MTASASLSADPARMRPLWFEGRFGWLHGVAPAGATGVVLCGALAQEEVCTRYGLMLLADALAAAGRPTLRFDYRATGDSADGMLSTASMIDDIVRAVDCLRQEAGVGPVILCGLRVGGSLVLEAARRVAGLAGVALLAPIVSGAAYLRDMGVSVRFSPLALLDPVPPTGSGATLNTNGFHWSADLRDDVRALDLVTAPAPTVPALVATPHGSARAAAAVAAWRDRGVVVTDIDFADYPGFMRDPTTHVMPHATFAAVVDWVTALPGDGPPIDRAPTKVADRLDLGAVEELPVRLGATFGILCRPRDRPPAPVAALMLHEGSSHHIGNGRAQVALARRLAADGYASLRLDLTGMGDSPCAAGRRRPFSDPDRVAEAVAGVEALAVHAPGGIVASGLCSGAEMAFHTALADARVIATLLVNIPAIGWDPTAETGGAPPPARRTMRSSWRAIRAGGWRRVIRGEIRVIDAARGLRREGARARRASIGRVHRQMRALADRGVRTIFLFSDDDPGLRDVRAQVGDIADFAPARIEIFDRADHHFNGSDIRRRYDALYRRTIEELTACHAAKTVDQTEQAQ